MCQYVVPHGCSNYRLAFSAIMIFAFAIQAAFEGYSHTESWTD